MLDTGDGYVESPINVCIVLTYHSAIDARVTLIATPPRFPMPPSQPYTFVADVKTFNGPLKMQVNHAPLTPPIPLQLTVQNNDGKTNVTLDKSYEGTFHAQSKLEKVSIRHPFLPSSSDPLGVGRSRSFQFDQESPNRIRGWIGWGKRPSFRDDTVQGQIKIISPLSPINLQFGT